jgi:predicted DNA-binding protein with PD1-like motif
MVAHLSEWRGASTIQERLELAAGKPACGEVAAVDDDERVHRGAVLSEESQAVWGGRFHERDRDRGTFGGHPVECLASVITEVAAGRRDHSDAS